MENNALYTRCPTCSTAFKVTDKLLAMAGGKVRCGACLAIFQANDYMLEPSNKMRAPVKPAIADDQQQTPIQEAPQQTTRTETTDVQQELDIAEQATNTDSRIDPKIDFDQSEFDATDMESINFDQQEIDDAKIDEVEIENLNFEEPDVETHDSELPDFELPDSEQPDSEQTETKLPDIKESPDSDELAIEQDFLEPMDIEDPLIDEEAVEEEVELQESVEDIIPEPEVETDNEIERDNLNTSDFSEEQPELNAASIDENSLEPSQKSDEQLDDLGTDEIDFSELDEEPPMDIVQQMDDIDFEDADPVDVNETEIDESTDDESEFEDETDFLDGTEFTEETQVFDALDSGEELSGQLTEQMLDTDSEPDPLDEFEDIVEENNNSLKIKLAVASLVVLLVAALSSIWTNRQAIAWSENWGGTMISVCQYLPCDLKPRRDVSKIRLLQRQLTPDEELENVLDVKVLLINEAAFDQPYPTIKITFSNRNSEPVSVKTFTPADYLDKQSLNDLMPAGSEVHISFKTEEKHPDALGFQFTFE